MDKKSEQRSMAIRQKELSKLHPAAFVFRTVIAGEIAAENKRYMENTERLQPFLDHIQNVEVIDTINDAPIPMNREIRNGMTVFEASVPVIRRIVARAKLSEGNIKDLGDGKRLCIQIDPSHDIILQNIGCHGGIRLRLADNSVGMFPRSPLSVDDSEISVSISDETDTSLGDTAYLTIHLGAHASIRGELNRLSNDEIVKVKEGGGRDLIHGYLRMMLVGDMLGDMTMSMNTTSPTFRPTMIEMDLTADIKAKLCTIGKATSSASPSKNIVKFDERSPPEELRHLAIAAFGDDEHSGLLKENNRLEYQHMALIEIRETLMKGEISHNGGTLRFSLDEGEYRELEGKSFWIVRVDGKENSTMAVEYIKQSELYLSGTKWNKNGDLFHHLGQPSFYRTGYIPLAGLRLPIASGVEVFGLFDWRDQNVDEIPSIIDNFHRPAMNGNPVPASPSTFKIDVTTIIFDQRSVGNVLRMFSLGEEFVLKSDQARSGNE